MTAARDGALTIYHFGCAIEGLTASLPLCPALNALVNRQQLKIASKIFKAAFPGDTAIRHVVAHVADFSMTPDQKEHHAVKGAFTSGGFGSTDPQGVTWLRGNLNENRYTISFQGKAFTYELSSATVNKLRSIKERIYSAFDAATIKKSAS
jgi:hypothetical protein